MVSCSNQKAMLVFLCFQILSSFLAIDCLYPRDSPTRETLSLDGIWNFLICPQNKQNVGFHQKWHTKRLSEVGEVIPMPVPASFNDITQNKTIQDYLGWSWYQTEFFTPKRWEKDFTVFLRFGSVHYNAKVYVNDEYVFGHTSGHLPFQGDITKHLETHWSNFLTVAVNNTLSHTTIPQGTKRFHSKPYPPGYYTSSVNMDFYNYAGIHRPVMLYAVPTKHIDDVTITTDIKGSTGYVNYSVSTHASIEPVCTVTAYDKSDTPVAHQKGCHHVLEIPHAKLWWPFTTHPDPGYQYTLKIEALFKKASGRNITDIYFQKFGIRTARIEKNQFMVNGKPFYFTGFGKHEDFNVIGRGFDIPLIVKDFNLIKWIGANSFRTSHYPYSEELMDHADEQGIVVIDECPAVALNAFNDELLKLHKQLMKEMIARDKNRPSVFAWSVANEPLSYKLEADYYFRKLVKYVKSIDVTHRPLTAAIAQPPWSDKAGKYLDMVMHNQYYGWYEQTGSIETIYNSLVHSLEQVFHKYKKPILMSEYGADSVAGLHTDPSYVFTEDYQTELMVQHFRAFDTVRKKGFFVGEHIWHFADFMTNQQINRVVGNKKGIFTRDRQPKAAARLLRCRYHELGNLTIEGSLAYCYRASNSCEGV